MSGRKQPISDWGLIKRLVPYLVESKGLLWWTLLMIPIGVGFELCQPLLLKEGIDEGIIPGDAERIGEVALSFIVVVFAAFLARTAGMYALQLAGFRALARLRSHVFSHVMGQGQQFFDERTTGALMTRTTNDVEAIQESLTWGAVGLIADALMILGTLVAMLVLDWRLTLVSFAMSPVIVILVNVFRKRLRILFVEIRKALSRLNGFFAEQIYGMQVIQLNGAEAHTQASFRGQAHRFLKAYREANWWDAGLYAIMDGMSALAVAGLLMLGAYLIGLDSGLVTLGLLVAFIDYLTKVFVPIREFSSRLATIQRSIAAMERVFGLLDAHNEVQTGEHSVPDAPMTIRFESVSFRYREERDLVLRSLNLELSPGEVVAVVGATGSGKSTIAKLMLRMYDQYDGQIWYGDREIRDYRTNEIRERVVAVHQDPYLFDASLADNISLWDTAIPMSRVQDAATHSRASQFIEELEKGYDHIVAKRGANLSAGQRQLVSMARAISRDAPVVILDEATASVDSMTERLIDQAVDTLFAQRTVLVIAHRISTIIKADRILVMNNGQIVEQGGHEELLVLNGHYKRLVESGFSL